MRNKWLISCLALPLMLLAGESESLKLRCIPSPNLVRNADFSQLDEKGLPREWSFDNCSRSPEFKSQVVRHPEGNYLAIDTAWIKFGYWLQNVPVEEGKTYWAAAEVQSDAPGLAIWLRCQPTGKIAGRPTGKTEYLFHANLRNGDEMKEMLKDFIDEELLSVLSSKNWNTLGKEIVVPRDRGIKICAMRIGIYGGRAGQGRYRNPVFREAKTTLQAKITGTGWTQLRAVGAKPETVKLDPSKAEQNVSMVLPHAGRIYKVELSGKNGRRASKEVINE